MKKDFVIRGQTASGQTDTLNFSGHKKGYAYKITEFDLYGSTSLGGTDVEASGSITAAKTAEDPINPNFENQGLIATSHVKFPSSASRGAIKLSVVNDTFMITQDLLLKVFDTGGNPVNWQCRFESVKMSGPQEAVANYKQYLISDE